MSEVVDRVGGEIMGSMAGHSCLTRSMETLMRQPYRLADSRCGYCVALHTAQSRGPGSVSYLQSPSNIYMEKKKETGESARYGPI